MHVPRIGISWREEYSWRLSILRQWRKHRAPSRKKQQQNPRSISLNQTYDVRTGSGTQVCFPDFEANRLICTSDRQGTITISELSTGHVSKDMVFPELQSITAMALSRMGVLFGQANGAVTLGIWPRGVGTMARRYASLRSTRWRNMGDAHAGVVKVVAFLASDQSISNENSDNISSRTTIVSADDTGVVHCFSLDGNRLADFNTNLGMCDEMHVNSLSRLIIVTSATGRVFLLSYDIDPAVDARVNVLDVSGDDVLTKPASQLLSSGQFIFGFRSSIWAITAPATKTKLPQIHEGDITCISQSLNTAEDGSSRINFASGDLSGLVAVWNVVHSDPQHVISIDVYGDISCLSLTSVVLAVGTLSGNISIHDCITGECLRRVDGHRRGETDVLGAATSIILDRNVSSLKGLAAHDGRHVRYWDFGTPSNIHGVHSRLRKPSRPVPKGSATPDGNVGSKADILEQISDEIAEAEELAELQHQRHEQDKRQWESINGPSREDDVSRLLSESELLQYVQMLSLDEATSSPSAVFPDDESESVDNQSWYSSSNASASRLPSRRPSYIEASTPSPSLRASRAGSNHWLGESKVVMLPPSNFSPRQPPTSSFNDDLDFAIQLSLVSRCCWCFWLILKAEAESSRRAREG